MSSNTDTTTTSSTGTDTNTSSGSTDSKQLTVEEFKQYFTVKVVRYETYPSEEPNCYCVGLIARSNNGKSERYIDVQVPFSESNGKTESEIVQLAWDKLKNDFISWGTVIYNKPSVIGSVVDL